MVISDKRRKEREGMKVSYAIHEGNRVIVCSLSNNNGLQFKGKAKCSECDTFDIDIGKNIAYARALVKMYKAQRANCKYWLDHVDNWIENVQAENNKAESKLYSLQNYLKKFGE